MHINDPAREKVGDLPALQGFRSIVPTPYVRLLPDGKIQLMFFAPVGVNRFVPKYTSVAPSGILVELTSYWDDPEGYLERTFGIDLEAARQNPPPTPLQRVKVMQSVIDGLSIEDLLK